MMSPVIVPPAKSEKTFLVFQLSGNSWTQIVGREAYRHDWFERWLSQELERGTRIFTLRNGREYSLWESTSSFSESPDEIEHFSETGGSEYYEYSSKYHLKAASHEYEITKLDHACLFTKRGTRLNMESPSQLGTFLNGVTAELGIYAAAEVFEFDESCECHLLAPWQRSDFRAARLLRFVTEHEWQQRVFGDLDEEQKLEIRPDPESFERMQRIFGGEIPAVIPSELDQLFRECEKKANERRHS